MSINQSLNQSVYFLAWPIATNIRYFKDHKEKRMLNSEANHVLRVPAKCRSVAFRGNFFLHNFKYVSDDLLDRHTDLCALYITTIFTTLLIVLNFS